MKNIKYNLGLVFVFIIQLVALVLLFISPSFVFDFSTTYNTTLLLGKVAGILGMTLFATSLILSARFHFLENIFYGLNKVYERHGQIGQIAFIMMLFHPLLLLYKYTDLSFDRAISFLTPSPYTLANNFGIIAVYLMIVLIFLTLYFRPKYHIWKWTHKFMGLAFFLAGLHVFLIPSDTSSFLPLRVYMLFISAVAIYSYIYHTVLGIYTTKKYKYAVCEVKDLGENITEVILATKGEKIPFKSGQYAFISFDSGETGRESHPFSLSSKEGEDNISFTIKNLGDFTSRVKNLKLGTIANIEGPFGKFSYNTANSKKQIWIAGGIGVTPFLSMAKSIQKENGYDVDLYYCVRNPKEAVYLEELLALKDEKVNIIPHFSDTMGFINADIIKEKSGSIDNKSIFICSPVFMIKMLKKQFSLKGVPGSSIYSEEFSL